jgi:hypothetical protein
MRILIRFFIFSAGVLLSVTAFAKLISGFGTAHILLQFDPIFRIQFRYLIFGVGILELIIAAVCFFASQLEWKTKLVALLSTNFLLYRLGLFFIGYHKPCPCLGGLTDAINVSPRVADITLKIILAYLLIGSYGILFHQWWKNRRPAVGKSELGGENSQMGAGS